MPDAWRSITALVASIVEPNALVKQRGGFADLTAPEVPKLLAIERSRWNVPQLRRFSLVLKIYVAARDAPRFSPGQMDQYTPVILKNVGYLWGDEVFMYTVPDIIPSEELSRQLRLHLTQHVLPFLRRCSSVDSLIEVVDSENARRGVNLFSASMAVALARLGRTEQSRRYFQESLGDPGVLRQMASHYGIIL